MRKVELELKDKIASSMNLLKWTLFILLQGRIHGLVGPYAVDPVGDDVLANHALNRDGFGRDKNVDYSSRWPSLCCFLHHKCK